MMRHMVDRLPSFCGKESNVDKPFDDCRDEQFVDIDEILEDDDVVNRFNTKERNGDYNDE
jgi:hypothetical protein